MHISHASAGELRARAAVHAVQAHTVFASLLVHLNHVMYVLTLSGSMCDVLTASLSQHLYGLRLPPQVAPEELAARVSPRLLHPLSLSL